MALHEIKMDWQSFRATMSTGMPQTHTQVNQCWSLIILVVQVLRRCGVPAFRPFPSFSLFRPPGPDVLLAKADAAVVRLKEVELEAHWNAAVATPVVLVRTESYLVDRLPYGPPCKISTPLLLKFRWFWPQERHIIKMGCQLATRSSRKKTQVQYEKVQNVLNLNFRIKKYKNMRRAPTNVIGKL